MIGIYGGSFDPIHNGHLRAALETCEQLQLQKILFIPCYHHAFNKCLHASSEQRLAMLQLAIQGNSLFTVDDREINQPSTSYTIDTLISLHKEYPKQKFALIIGTDAFLQFHQWHRWREILHYANIIILHRPG